MRVEDIVAEIESHRCYSHPVFEHWAQNDPSTDTIGALFHQIRCFCDSTRPGLNLPDGLRQLGLGPGGDLLQQIVESEEDHGPQLATMAGHILNRAAGRTVCPDVYDQTAVEGTLKQCSDKLLGALPGYDAPSGLMPQTREAIAVFHRRRATDEATIYKNLGTTLALEMISHRHLIPGEKRCLIDSGLYRATLTEPEMHYLEEHWGECGAEAMHEQNARDALATILNDSNAPLVRQGARDFLETVAAMWDLLDAALLESGRPRAVAALAS